MLGTIIGFVILLSNLSDLSQLGLGVSIAFITTFYGVFLAYMFFLPIAGRMSINSTEELVTKEILLAGMVVIAEGRSKFELREKLMMLLSDNQQKKYMQERIKDEKDT